MKNNDANPLAETQVVKNLGSEIVGKNKFEP